MYKDGHKLYGPKILLYQAELLVSTIYLMFTLNALKHTHPNYGKNTKYIKNQVYQIDKNLDKCDVLATYCCIGPILSEIVNPKSNIYNVAKV